MDILEAIVAFSLLMIVFSTIVSAIVEFINRIGHRRELGFQRVIERMYDEMRQRILPSDGPVSDVEREAFKRAIITNKAIVDPPSLPTHEFLGANLLGPIGLLRWAYRFFASWFTPRHVAKMDAVEFVRRMAETKIGRDIARRGEATSEKMIEEISTRFDEHSTQAREFFRQNAYALSILVSVGFAFFANIDAVRLFEALKDDARLRGEITSKADRVIKNFEAQQKIIQEAIDRGETPDPQKVEELNQQVENQLASFKGTLPIGYAYFPGCFDKNVDPRCTDLETKKVAAKSPCKWDGFQDICAVWSNIVAAPFTAVKWFLSVLTAGLLIGLGGPFWFNVYANLSRVLGLAKAVRGAFGGKAKTQEEATAPPEQAANDAPTEAFKKASRVVRSTRPRPILGPNGEPI